MHRADVLIVGGGIVGLATARAILRAHPGRALTLVEKEAAVGTHQSGRNSGVIHAGVYYQPGSAKARMCTAGRKSMVGYCEEHGIPYKVCGKVVVATDEDERARLLELERRCEANGVRTELIGPHQLRELEPHVRGVAALHVLDTGIVDYANVCRSLAAEVSELGATIKLETAVTGAQGEHVMTSNGPIDAERIVTCAGLQADLVAETISGPGATGGMRVIAFRGEYRELVPAREDLVNGLVYPVPDPDFPFLGVHLTRGINGHVHVGPNAVLAFAREGYTWRPIDRHHLAGTFKHKGFRKFAARELAFRCRRDGPIVERPSVHEGRAAPPARGRAR